MLNVYKVSVIVRLKYKKFFKIKQTTSWKGVQAIMANNESEAIKKRKDKILERIGDNYYKNGKRCIITDIEIEVWENQPFTINELKDKLSADDFMLYCKQRMGIEDVIEIISE